MTPRPNRTAWRATLAMALLGAAPPNLQAAPPNADPPAPLRPSRITPQTGPQNAVTFVPFTVETEGTFDAPVNWEATADNPVLIPNGQLMIQGAGRHRALVVVPGLDQTGETAVTLRARQNGRVIHEQSFSLNIEPDPNRHSAALMLSALVTETPPRITLIWTGDPTAQSYQLYRRDSGSEDWGEPLAKPSAGQSSHVDTHVVAGRKYEYRLTKSGRYLGSAYLEAGIRVSLVEDRGTILLLVEESAARELAFELARLEKDLVGDGWRAVRREVGRDADVALVKSVIQEEHRSNPNGLRSVFLFGHVPVPYSGIITAPDGHTTDAVAGNHQGAWPADVYYADLDGVWTDEQSADRHPESAPLSRLPNRNFPGDGKFDQDLLPSDVELEIGRVDLFNMTEFLPQTETDLLRQYLDKNHQFRQRQWIVPRRGIVLDRFPRQGEDSALRKGLPPASRDGAAFFGSARLTAKDWFPEVATEAYLFGYAEGPAHDTGIYGWVGTEQFAAVKTRVVFNQLFGSYFGDWHTGNNLLRAPLASGGYGLTCSWGGRPVWKYYPMALGHTAGYATRLTQNNRDDDQINGRTGLPFNRGVWIALMGDPSLRLHPVAPPTELMAQQTQTGLHLSWQESQDTVEGYWVFRSPHPHGPFTRLTPDWWLNTEFTDATPDPQGATYLVKAVKLEISASGTYYNSSQGAFTTVKPCLPGQEPPQVTLTPPPLPAEVSDPARVPKKEFQADPADAKPTIHAAVPKAFSARAGQPIQFRIRLEGGPTEINQNGIIEYSASDGRTSYFDVHRTPTFSRQWTGTLTYEYSWRLPRNMTPGTYAVYYILGIGPHREELRAGPGVQTDGQHRYRIATLTVLSDAEPPSVVLSFRDGSSLSDGQLMAGKRALKVRVTDASHLRQVELFFNQQALFRETLNPPRPEFTHWTDWDVSRHTNGIYELKAVATDTAQNSRTLRYQIAVANPLVYPWPVPDLQVPLGQAFTCDFAFGGGPLPQNHDILVWFRNTANGRIIGPMKHQPVPPTSQWTGRPIMYRKDYARFPLPGTFEVWVGLEAKDVMLQPGQAGMAYDEKEQRYRVGTLTVRPGR